MHKVVTINLNGQAYQFDEDAFEALRAYLDRAEAQLRDNPDRTEILADLEQAIADKCRRYLNAHKTVIASEEILKALEEMGPVEGTSDAAHENAGATTASPGDPGGTGSAPRRLYRIEDGAMIGGVCNGIAAFFDIDVTLVRVIFVVLAATELASSRIGAIVMAYVVMMLVVPLAGTSEEQAAAHGVRLNAQEVIDRAKRNIAEFNNRGWWRHQREWRRQRRRWARQWRHTTRFAGPWSGWGPVAPSADYGTRVAAGVMTSIIALASLVLLLTFLYGLMSLVLSRGIYTWRLPDKVPLSMAIVGLVLTYYVVAWPLHMARRATLYALSGSVYAWDAGGYGLISTALAALFFWLAYQHVPEVRAFVQQLPEIWENIQRAFVQAQIGR